MTKGELTAALATMTDKARIAEADNRMLETGWANAWTAAKKERSAREAAEADTRRVSEAHTQSKKNYDAAIAETVRRERAAAKERVTGVTAELASARLRSNRLEKDNAWFSRTREAAITAIEVAKRELATEKEKTRAANKREGYYRTAFVSPGQTQKLKDDLIAANAREADANREVVRLGGVVEDYKRWLKDAQLAGDRYYIRAANAHGDSARFAKALKNSNQSLEVVRAARSRAEMRLSEARAETNSALAAAEIERDRYQALKHRVDDAHKMATNIAGALVG